MGDVAVSRAFDMHGLNNDAFTFWDTTQLFPV